MKLEKGGQCEVTHCQQFSIEIMDLKPSRMQEKYFIFEQTEVWNVPGRARAPRAQDRTRWRILLQEIEEQSFSQYGNQIGGRTPWN